MRTYYYKGFRFYKGKNPYYGKYYVIGNKEVGQIAPTDNVVPRTIRECKQVINRWLKN